MTPAHQSAEIEQQPAYWSGVFAMTLCVFALIASEFMPVSLLTPIAIDLSVTEGLAGYGIAISGAFAVMTSLSISRLAGDMNRKTLLLGLTALMAISGAVVALAPNYWVYMFGRALIGVVVGGFWSMSAATAIRLVPTTSVPKALAIFNSGNALATVVAPPLGSYLGAMIGWRGAFFCLVPIAILAFIWQWISLPSLKNQRSVSTSSGGIFQLLSQRRIQALRPQLEAYEKLCAELGHRPALVALAWLLHNPAVTSVISGVRTVEQLQENIKALDIQLSVGTLAKLDEIWPPCGEAPQAYAW
ncbi:MFS transporter (plasmid) [Acinetobacter seifertii]|nr:MFS transporter [Acinetobacter seifertii]